MVLEPMMSKTVKFLVIAALCFVGFATKANAQAIGQLQAGQIWGNPTSGQALARGTLPGPIWDQAYGCGQNQVLNRGASLWTCTISPVLGVAGTSVGSIGFQNATSGTETIKPATGALGSGIATLPAGTYNLAGDSLTQTLTNKTFNCANNTCTVRLASDVTGNLPLTNLAIGSLDQVIGYFGATTGNAISINNCANALTYSTSTHTFGCNVGAGTGTVTNVATGGLATGGPITSTGTVTVTAAVKSDQTTATSTTVAVVPGVQQYHPSAAKAWASMSGTCSTSTCTLGDTYNVSQITRSGTGIYTATFSTAFADANFACFVTINNGIAFMTRGNSQTTTTYTFAVDTATGSASDSAVNIVCFGPQ